MSLVLRSGSYSLDLCRGDASLELAKHHKPPLSTRVVSGEAYEGRGCSPCRPKCYPCPTPGRLEAWRVSLGLGGFRGARFVVPQQAPLRTLASHSLALRGLGQGYLRLA